MSSPRRIGRLPKSLAVVVAVVGALTLAFASPALARWSTSGLGSGTASTGTLNAPTDVTATSTAGTGSARVDWTASAVSGTAVAPTGYRVKRTNSVTGSVSTACASDTTPVTGTSCTDSSVSDGTYSYTVIAVRGSWSASSSASGSVTVTNTVDTTMSLTSSPNPSAAGQEVTYTAMVTAGSGTPTGSVVFKEGISTLCTRTLTAGSASCAVTYSAVGSHTITATFTGTGTFGPSSATVTQSVGKGSQTISFTSTPPTSATVGGPTYQVVATASSNLQVNVTSGSSNVCTVSGTTVSFVGVGTCMIKADQAGDANYDPAPTAQQSFPVGAAAKASQTITITSIAPTDATVGGRTYTVVATASSGLAVTISSASTTVCTVSGSVVTFIGAGTCSINANQSGNATYSAAPQVSQSFAVAAAPATPDGLQVRSDGTTVTATWTTAAGTYECAITSGSSTPATSDWAACTSPKQFSAQSGKRTFWVRAVRGGAASAAASASFSG